MHTLLRYLRTSFTIKIFKTFCFHNGGSGGPGSSLRRRHSATMHLTKNGNYKLTILSGFLKSNLPWNSCYTFLRKIPWNARVSTYLTPHVVYTTADHMKVGRGYRCKLTWNKYASSLISLPELGLGQDCSTL